jgi:hypothetical protein
LIEVIAEKNKTIARINGEMYYLKKWYDYHKQKKQEFYNKLYAEFREKEAKNGK